MEVLQNRIGYIDLIDFREEFQDAILASAEGFFALLTTFTALCISFECLSYRQTDIHNVAFLYFRIYTLIFYLIDFSLI